MEKEAGSGANKRRSVRYPIGDAFPFKVKLTLFSKDGEAKAKDWSATPADLSASGASVQLSLAAVAFQKDPCRLKFSKGDYLLELPATINHFRCKAQYSLCGITFNFTSPELQNAYRQFLEPVIIGNSLPPATAEQDIPGRHKERFGGGPSAELTIVRTTPGGTITGFDLRMNDYLVRWAEGAPELELICLNDENPGVSSMSRAPYANLQYEEIRRLFSFTIPNLSPEVPADVRKFFKGLVPA